jgi:hypothetical protein
MEAARDSAVASGKGLPGELIDIEKKNQRII